MLKSPIVSLRFVRTSSDERIPESAVSSQLADDIAKKVFNLIKSDLPSFQQSPADIKEERSFLDSKLVFVICSFSEYGTRLQEGLGTRQSRLDLRPNG